MRNVVTLAVAGLVLAVAVADALAQQRRTQTRPPAPPASTVTNPYGLPDCSQRPFARDCDRRGTW